MRIRSCTISFLVAACGPKHAMTSPTVPTIPAAATDSVYQEKAVDRPVQLINMPKPDYPPDLQVAGVCGYADMRYIVGTD